MEQAPKPTAITLIIEYLETVAGYFSLDDCCKTLGFISPKQRNTARVALHRLVKTGTLERYGTRDGLFRRPDKKLDRMDFINASTKGVKIWLPLDLHKMVKLLPGEIIIIAGVKSAGKTTFALNIAWANRNTWTVNYYNSEMSPAALKNKLELFRNTDLMEWAEKINFYSRRNNFQDILKTTDNNLNIIDYLAETKDYWLITNAIYEIHDKIVNTKTNAVICLQKPRGRDEAIGGGGTLDKAMLYLAVNKGSIKIVDAKNWIGENPNDQGCTFKLINGSDIIPHSPWESGKTDRWSG